jgi:hypothetical protein
MYTLPYAALPLFAGMVSVFAQDAGSPPSTDVLKDLAPGGKLHAAINLGNSVLAQTDAATGRPKIWRANLGVGWAFWSNSSFSTQPVRCSERSRAGRGI